MTSLDASAQAQQEGRRWWSPLVKQEDWWAVWIGVGLVIVATALVLAGSSIKWLAVTPAKWSNWQDLPAQFSGQWLRYGALFLAWLALFGGALSSMGIRLREFAGAFAALFLVSWLIFLVGQWDQASYYNLEPPLVALALGLLVSNLFGTPTWLQGALRVEFYIKIGIVLLGATLPLSLIRWAGPIAILQASAVSITTYLTIFWVGRWLGLEQRLAAVLGVGGAVCGVSGAIAVAGAIGAKKEHASLAITLVILWAIVMIFVLPLTARYLALPTGVAGAWIGTSEFADAAGLAAAQTYSGYAGRVPGIAGTPDAALTAFTLMKVVGRDAWIGIWAFVLALVATTRWENQASVSRARASDIWERFPKFVLGFVLASLVITWVTGDAALSDFNRSLNPLLVLPLKNLRTWAFIFCFLSIGLNTRVRDLQGARGRPFWAFTAGVVVNIVVGYLLSTQVFVAHWSSLGQH